MKNYDTILTENQQKYQHYLSGKIEKYEYVTNEGILPSNQRSPLESPLEKAFKKQTKTIEDQEIKQVKALKVLKPKENQDLQSIEGAFSKKYEN